MFGFDLFFKTAAAGMKVAQKSVENMFRLMELCLQQQPRAEKEIKASSEKAGAVENEPSSTPPPAEAEVSMPASTVAKEAIENGAAAEIKTEEKVPTKSETKKNAPKRYVGARSEAILERTAVSAKKAPETKKKAIPKKKPIPSTAKSVPPKKPAVQKSEPVAAVEVVKRILSEKKKPLKTEEIMKVTGYKKKKVQDSLYKLKKRGDIKMVEKGVYVKN